MTSSIAPGWQKHIYLTNMTLNDSHNEGKSGFLQPIIHNWTLEVCKCFVRDVIWSEVSRITMIFPPLIINFPLVR